MNNQEQVKALRSALAQAGAGQAGFRTDALAFREIENRAAVRLRALSSRRSGDGDPGSLPPNTGECLPEDPAVLCLRPGEWLAVSHTLTPHELLARMRARYDAPGFFAWDHSEALALIRLEGEAASWLLRKHCGLDIPVVPARKAHCAQTRFAQAGLLIYQHLGESAQVFDLYVDRSLAVYLWNLLADSASHAVQLHGCFGADRVVARDPARS